MSWSEALPGTAAGLLRVRLIQTTFLVTYGADESMDWVVFKPIKKSYSPK